MTPPRDDDNATIRIVIPFKLRHRNGRPRIVPPDIIDATDGAPAQNPHLLRTIARAWSWRRKLKRGAATTLQDLAAAEKISDRFISRTLRLAYLSPAVLEKLVTHRRPCALSIKDLATAAELSWVEQEKKVFNA
jgi:hypothetical protein